MGAECRETAGFLFKHPCGRQATGECADCGKAVCDAHLKQNPKGVLLCVACLKMDLARGAPPGPGRDQPPLAYENDPYFYGSAHYAGYGRYRSGWGSDYYAESAFDGDDFTEADGAAFATEGDEGWEQDMGAS
ncbi:MAG: hypothetical protein AB7N76_00295 [Planctomycetota bacterium]